MIAPAGFCVWIGLLLFTAPHARAQARKEVLEGLAESVMKPAYLELAAACAQLEKAAAELKGGTTAAGLKSAQAAWVKAMLTARRVQFHKAGPLTDLESDASFFYWQILKGRVEEVVASETELNDAYLDRLGATAKGLFAVEYLLFDYPAAVSSKGQEAGAHPPLLTAAHQARRLEYLQLLTRDLSSQAEALAGLWRQDGPDSPKALFAAGGQETVNLVVNELAMELEAVKSHLDLVLALRQPLAPQLHRIEAARSGTSVSGMRERIIAAAEFFRGKDLGLDDIVRPLNSRLADRLDAEFTDVIRVVGAIGTGLEEALMTDRASVERAQKAAHRLEILFKVDLASTLGVTITFSSNDGD